MRDPVADGLDLQALRDYLRRSARPGRSKLTARLLAGGKSNLTYAVADGTHTWVVRRPPLGHILATAHDMGREYRVSRRWPTPPLSRCREWSLLCSDVAVIGRAVLPDGRLPGMAIRDLDMLAGWVPMRSAPWSSDWSTSWPTCTPSTRNRWGWATSAARRATTPGSWTAGREQMAASRTGDVPGLERSDRRSSRADRSRIPAADDRARRLPAGQRAGRIAEAAGRWGPMGQRPGGHHGRAGLGDVHARRSARAIWR